MMTNKKHEQDSILPFQSYWNSSLQNERISTKEQWNQMHIVIKKKDCLLHPCLLLEAISNTIIIFRNNINLEKGFLQSFSKILHFLVYPSMYFYLISLLFTLIVRLRVLTFSIANNGFWIWFSGVQTIFK